MERNKYARFIELKNEISVGKGVKNTYGGFYYRTVEQIFEALKPLELKYNILVEVDSELKVYNEKLFHEATATARDIESGEIITKKTSYAEFQPKDAKVNMNESQLSGSVESYAVKRALQMLVGLDDGLDADDEKQSPTFTLKLGGEEPLKPIIKKQEEIVKEKITTKPIRIERELFVPKVDLDSGSLDISKVLYNLKQQSLFAETQEQINELKAKLQEVGGDEMTQKVLEAKEREINSKMTLKM